MGDDDRDDGGRGKRGRKGRPILATQVRTPRESRRAQTTQDYLIGITILLVATTFVFGYAPSLFDAYEEPVDSAVNDRAVRAAEYLVANYSVDGSPNVLAFNESGGINRTLSRAAGVRTLRERAGLNISTDRRAKPNVNVVIVNSTEIERGERLRPIRSNGVTFEYGDRYRDQNAASISRVIRLRNDGAGHCEPVCWLVVRVW